MTNLTLWEPFRELADIDSIFDRFFGRNLTQRIPLLKLGRDGFWSPAIELKDEKDRVVVKAEIPGVDKKDIKVNIDGDVLSIKGETKKEQEVKEKDRYYSEIVSGSFYRTIPLPVTVQKDKVKASYKDGILTIDLPKSEETKSKETEIQVQ